MHWNVVLDEREDGTKVWSAKCLRCDAVLVGEHAHPIPVVTLEDNVPPSQFDNLRRQLKTAWEKSRATGEPIIVPDRSITISTIPDHGLQRALDAHSEACSKR